MFQSAFPKNKPHCNKAGYVCVQKSDDSTGVLALKDGAGEQAGSARTDLS
jgi:hypothetical protein